MSEFGEVKLLLESKGKEHTYRIEVIGFHSGEFESRVYKKLDAKQEVMMRGGHRTTIPLWEELAEGKFTGSKEAVADKATAFVNSQK